MTDLHLKLPPPSDELRRDRRLIALAIAALAIVAALLAYRFHPFRGPTELLHVSYDASREFYQDLNTAYLADNREGAATKITMSHAGSVRQAQALVGGHVADIVSLASDYDLETLSSAQDCLSPAWRDALPDQSAPFHSSIALVTRKGNPKNLRDWPDLWRRDVSLALPSPSASGAGRWAFLAFYAEALAANPNETAARRHLQELILRAQLFDAGARQSLLLFQNNSRADAFLTWESEALRLAPLGHPELEAVYLPRSIRTEPRIAQVVCHTAARGTTAMALDYLQFHYTTAAQQIAAAHGLRPLEAPADAHFPPTQLYPLAQVFPQGPRVWQDAFAPGGFFPHLQTLRQAQSGGRE